MTDDADMMRQRRHLYALGNVLSRRFHMCSIEVKNTLFRSFCTPMYTCQLWWKFSVQSMHKLNVAYNNAFRLRLKILCFVRSVHQCILASYGGIFLYKVCIN